MEETLVIKAVPSVREKLRAVFWIRLSSSVAIVVPALACTVFLWLQSQPPPDAVLPGADPSLDVSSTIGMYSVIWNVWLPLGIMSLVVGGVLAWLARRAYLGYSREYRFTPAGVERRESRRVVKVPWGKIAAAELGGDITLRLKDGAWTMAGDWMGRETADAAERYVKARLPKEKIVVRTGGLELALQRSMKLAPAVLAFLVAAITAVSLYWAFLRTPPPTP